LRLITYSACGRNRVGAVIKNLVVDLNLSYSAFLESKGEPFPETKADLELPPKMKSLIAKGTEGLERAKEAILFAQQREFKILGAIFNLPDVKLKAPVMDPSKIVCTGLNYEDYRVKLGLQYLPVPQIFLKAPSSLIGHMETIVIPQGYGVVFHEWEFSCIIAKTCRNVEKEKVGEAIFGYTIFNDITAHDIESKSRELQPWGKSFDTFAPMGPWIVTPDEMPDHIYNLRMVRRRNGKIETDSNTKNMQFHFDDIISFVSAFWTLNPGDVITTASPPAGPITPGDTIEAEIEGIGVLVNPVISGKTNLEYAKRVGLTWKGGLSSESLFP
jgi:2-keto-4-pentenoate hydratase/2-oxohepta-3-ene-1,7-dioic acid hydratase in catechol pathway